MDLPAPLGCRATASAADLSSAEAARGVVDTVVERTGRLDVLVNAAGVMLIGDPVNQPPEDWERMIDVNLRGLMHVTKAALPHLLSTAERPSTVADVVNISSVAGRVVSPHTALYTATKFAVTAASEAWRQEYAGRGVRFSVIEPGFVATELGSFQEATQQF